MRSDLGLPLGDLQGFAMGKIAVASRRSLLRIFVLALCALPMHGQTANTGAIAGTVGDPSGALVAGAALVVKSQATHEERDLTTDARGSFSVPFLAPGHYDLTVRATRFEPFTFNNVQVRITEVSRLKIQLTISGAKNTSRLAPSLLSFKLRTLRSDESSIETRSKNCRSSIATLPKS